MCPHKEFLENYVSSDLICAGTYSRLNLTWFNKCIFFCLQRNSDTPILLTQNQITAIKALVFKVVRKTIDINFNMGLCGILCHSAFCINCFLFEEIMIVSSHCFSVRTQQTCPSHQGKSLCHLFSPAWEEVPCSLW